MRFIIVNTDYGKESETDEQGNYSAVITIALQSDDNKIPQFSKDITVISNNSMTGFEVDKQREQAIEEFLKEFNN